MTLVFRFKIQVTHLRRKKRQFTDRTCDALRHKPDYKTTDDNDRNADIEIEFIGYGNALPNAFQRCTNQEITAVIHLTPAFHVFHAGKAVTHLLDHIIIILLNHFCMIFLLIKIIHIPYKSCFQKILVTSYRTYGLSVCSDHDPGQVILGTVLKHCI